MVASTHPQAVRIITTIFGRPTPLELEHWQIEKVRGVLRHSLSISGV